MISIGKSGASVAKLLPVAIEPVVGGHALVRISPRKEVVLAGAGPLGAVVRHVLAVQDVGGLRVEANPRFDVPVGHHQMSKR